MNEPDALPPEVVQLTNDVLNGRIDDNGVRALGDLLRGNLAAQRYFREFCQLHVDLHAESQAQRVIQAFASDDWGKSARSATASEQQDGVVCQPKISAIRAKSTTRVYRYVLAAAVSLALIAVSWEALRSDRGARSVATSVTPATVTAGADVVSVSIESAESRWLPIRDVGKIYIQGPAQLELIGSTRAKLKKGRVRVHITDPRGHGFVVETPNGQVTDLGTEFGVDVVDDSDTDVVVFEGKVDLSYQIGESPGLSRVERLVQGEGVTIGQLGKINRVMSVVRSEMATFRSRGRTKSAGDQLIVDVSDNIRSGDVKKFYEIVPRGLKEDALSYVDRPEHDWNGVDSAGMPPYLIRADYVKPFNSDKMRSDVEITVTLARPARLFVFFDDRVPAPDWLREGFRNTGDKIGHDVGRYELGRKKYYRRKRGKGPGVSVDEQFSIWEQVVARQGDVRLGPNSGASEFSAMYGIAAVPLEAQSGAESEKAPVTNQ